MSRASGAQHELQALTWLQARGLKLVARNYSCRSGEIDLIMLQESTLVFIEVRYRRGSNYGSAAESVDRRKQAKLTRTAQHYLLHHAQHAERNCRFDVLALSGASSAPQCEWIEDAFSA